MYRIVIGLFLLTSQSYGKSTSVFAEFERIETKVAAFDSLGEKQKQILELSKWIQSGIAKIKKTNPQDKQLVDFLTAEIELKPILDLAKSTPTAQSCATARDDLRFIERVSPDDPPSAQGTIAAIGFKLIEHLCKHAQ